MKIQQPEFPEIAAVPPGIYRPLWSVMIPTYNCTKYLETTLLSLLAQAPSLELMQIEVIDNCSTEGDPEALVKELGRGRLSFYRHSQNIGLIGNFNTCIKRSVGRLIHILHCDDLVLPGFYETLQRAFEQEPTIEAAFCRSVYINEEGAQIGLSPFSRATPGIFPDLLEWISQSHLIESPAFVVKRDVYERLGGFHQDLFHAGDTEIYMRIASQCPVWYEPASLASYRKHSQSLTSTLIESGANAKNVRRAMEISQLYLPKTIATQLREFEAINAFRSVCWLLVKLNFKAANIQMKEVWQLSHSLRAISKMVIFLAAFLAKGGVNRLRKVVAKVINRSRVGTVRPPAQNLKTLAGWVKGDSD